MTLIVSVRSAEGIVVAGDTLASTQELVPVVGDLSFPCTSCGKVNSVENHEVARVAVNLNTFPTARKVFPFLKRFGVGTYGLGVIADRTPFFAIRQFESEMYQAETEGLSVQECATCISDCLLELFEQTPQDMAQLETSPSGFQLSGYDGHDPVTATVLFKPDGTYELSLHPEKYFYTVSGAHDIVKVISDHYKSQGGGSKFVSLGDAIDYAEFILRTTIDYQRFGRRVPTVGGQIDIGQITPDKGYSWIRRARTLHEFLSEKGVER